MSSWTPGDSVPGFPVFPTFQPGLLLGSLALLSASEILCFPFQISLPLPCQTPMALEHAQLKNQHSYAVILDFFFQEICFILTFSFLISSVKLGVGRKAASTLRSCLATPGWFHLLETVRYQTQKTVQINSIYKSTGQGEDREARGQEGAKYLTDIFSLMPSFVGSTVRYIDIYTHYK